MTCERTPLARTFAVATASVLVALLLVACGTPEPRMLGTLEWDVVRLSAPVSERIDALSVREGEAVVAGQTVAVLDARVARAELAATEADAERAQRRLEELVAGPRDQRLDASRARLARARAAAGNATREHQRIAAIAARGLLPAAELDRARTALEGARADAAAAAAELAELRAGTRGEEIAQAESAVAAARARAAALAAQLGKLTVEAPRDGRIESLPFEVGDRPAAGATLATLLVGPAPHVRLYVPEPLRARVRPGTALVVEVDGLDAPLAGRVRSIAGEPSFTPYYALSGDDAARLVWLAEVTLDARASELPAGLPVRARFARDQADGTDAVDGKDAPGGG